MNNFWQLFKKKKFLAAIVMVLGFILFFVGFFAVDPVAPIKGYVVIFGFLMVVYGFINVLT